MKEEQKILCKISIFKKGQSFMKVLIVMDSFKGSLSSFEVAVCVEKGIKKVYPDAEVKKIAVADGGEGTVDALVYSLKGDLIHHEVTGPLGDRVLAKYGIVHENTAVIEMAEASGICLIDKDKRNPMIANTFGTGELILDALNRGCNRILLGIGGSATNDGGTGMAVALGARFLDAFGKELPLGGGYLEQLVDIDLSSLDQRIKNTEFLVACDVENPLFGDNGASQIYGPQKGANSEMVKKLDKGLMNLAFLMRSKTSDYSEDVAGAGAAGGLGYGLMAFCGATLKRGVDMVLDSVGVEDLIRETDIVITGEGRIDKQTIYGKLPVGVAKRAKKYNG